MIKFLLGAAVMFVLVTLWRRNDAARPHDAAPRRVLPPPGAEVERLVRADRLIEAIKLYRAETGCGLKEAKDEIDALRKRIG